MADQECTFIISRAPATDGTFGSLGLDADECRAFEDGVAAALNACGERVVVAPHIYSLSNAHPAVSRLDTHDDVVVASWLHPRAAYWTLRAHGVEGSFSDSTEPKSCGCAGPSARTIRCCDMRLFDDVDACVCDLRAGLGEAGGPRASGIEEVPGPVTARWYPVLDYSLCENCKQCMEFCLFGVYSTDDGRVVASEPDKCKPGCPACARVCPNGAIMFPHYTTDPAIAGAPGMKISDTTPDIEAFVEEFAKPGGALREPCPCQGQPGASAAAAQDTRPCACRSTERDDLDDLIDALDKLDD